MSASIRQDIFFHLAVDFCIIAKTPKILSIL